MVHKNEQKVNMRRFILCVCFGLFLGASVNGLEITQNDRLEKDPLLVRIVNSDAVELDLRYATDNNFMKRNVYGDFNGCFLHKIAAAKFKNAAEKLRLEKPGWKFLIFDCLRPRSIQRQMWNIVKNTLQKKYVADPKSGSLHNFGFAIDLGLIDDHGKVVDMGTPFDDFGVLAEPRQEEIFVQSGKLSQQQKSHRQILRSVMESAGFIQLPIEWWHFDGLSRSEVKSNFKIFE
jgi:D-alanyl-D-alanine dipeptidase